MDNIFFSAYKIEDRSYLSFIKREIHNLINKTGFSSIRAGELDIVVSELVSNIVKHAGSGELFYRLIDETDRNKAFEIFCIDNGPGHDNMHKMMKDGMSSSNTLGHGLGSIDRLSDFFQIYSANNWGTIAYARILMNEVPRKYTSSKDTIHLDSLQVCMPGEQICGDGYDMKKVNDETLIFLGDGLGHGEKANEAVQQAIIAFRTCEETEPTDIIRFIHQKVKKTRGLVGTIASYNHTSKIWKICGVGNIATRLYEGLNVKKAFSHNGIIGLNIPSIMSNYIMPKADYQHIIMFSDGIRNHWELNQYPSILKYSPAVIAATIFKDNARRSDDMTILVGKVN